MLKPSDYEPDREHFKAVVKAAKAMGGKSWESFVHCLKWLGKPAEGSENAKNAREVILYKDWSPLSFEFVVKRADGSRYYNGGIIYHPANSGGMAEGSITLSPQSFGHWQLHT